MIDIDENRRTKDSLAIKAIDVARAGFYKKYLIEHQFRVADICLKIADSIGMSREDRYFLAQEALLHDVGKFFVPKDILMKKGPLKEGEFEKLKDHARLGAEYLESRHFTEDIIRAVRYHHERFDGTGYPDGLEGEDIPLNSRIIAVADSFDAMTCGRHYKKPINKEMASRELLRSSGSQFDPEIADAFISQFMKREVV